MPEVEVRPADLVGVVAPGGDDGISETEWTLHALTQSLKQVRLYEYLANKAGVDVDRAGVALLYVLFVENTSLRVTDLAELLQIEAPAVTRKAQQLEQSGLLSRTRDLADGRATRLQLTKEGRRTINRILVVRREWLKTLISDWPESDQIEFSRLVRLFTNNLNQHLKELDA
jgi:DNA-binding MarR family transcriptional regulator